MEKDEIKFQSTKNSKAYLSFIPAKKVDLALPGMGDKIRDAVRDACLGNNVEIVFGKQTSGYLYLIVSFPAGGRRDLRDTAERIRKESGEKLSRTLYYPDSLAGTNFWADDFLLIPTGGGSPRDLTGVVEDFAEHINLMKEYMPKKSGNKCLVTGGAGFIGSNLADALIKNGYEVSIIDNLSTGKKEYINPKAKFFELDIRSAEVQRVFADESFDYVFHLAAQIDVRISVDKPDLDNSINVLGGLNILENCHRFKVKKIIFASTGGAVYGDADIIPTPESYIPAPISPYGINKLAFEKYLNYYHKIYGQEYAALRLANVYGPRQFKGGEAGVVSIFVDNAVNMRESIINGNGGQTRDYVFVGDVVAAFLRAMDSPISGEANIGTGAETSLLELVTAIETATGRPFLKKHGPAKPGEQLRSCLDNRKASEIMGWEPKVGLREGIQKTIDWSKLKRLIQSEK